MGTAAARGGRGIRRLVHDLADGAGTAAALGATAKAAIDLPGRARTHLRRHRGTDIVVAQNVAGANDHEEIPSGSLILEHPTGGKKNRRFLYVV